MFVAADEECMPDIDNKGPWHRPPERSSSKTAFVIWLVLLFAMCFGVWKLSELFPGQLSSDLNRANLIWLLFLLAVISAGVVRTGRRNLGELTRNVAIWLGLAAVLIVGFSYRT